MGWRDPESAAFSSWPAAFLSLQHQLRQAVDRPNSCGRRHSELRGNHSPSPLANSARNDDPLGLAISRSDVPKKERAVGDRLRLPADLTAKLSSPS